MRPLRAFAVGAAMVFAGALALGARDARAQDACARPNVPASAVDLVQPDVPPMALQQGINGQVAVIVSLDEQSHVLQTRIQSSPSAILNQAALVAARATTYRTEVRDCKPIPSQYLLTLDFPAPPPTPQPTAAPRGPTIVVTAEGSVTRGADIAYVNAMIDAGSADSANANAKIAAIFAAVSAKLRAVGIGADMIRSNDYDASAGRRRITALVQRPDDAPAVAAAMKAGGATYVAPIAYTLRDGEAALHDALALAEKSAQERGGAVAAARGLRLGAIVHRDAHATFGGATTIWAAGAWIPAGARTVPATLPEAQIVVSASVSVTYLIER